jgi:hypothetical protein
MRPPASSHRARRPDQCNAYRHEGIARHFDTEDGVWVNRPVYGYLVAFRTFPDTLAGAAQAQRVAANVQATLDAHGVKGLEAAAHRPRPISHHRSTRPGERTVTDPTETQHFLHTLV